MRRKALALLLLLVVSACAPEAGVVEMAVLQWNPETGAYELREARITTLDDVPSLRGDAALPIGNAEIVINGNRLAGVETEEDFRRAVLEDPGGEVEAQFIDRDGVLYPADFHSLNLATAYFNFEQSRLYALERGLDPEKLHRVPFFYFPDFYLQGGEAGRHVDNAAWFPALRSFVLYPFDRLQEIPLAMNQGVVAHEYGHGIFNAEVLGGAWLPDYTTRWCNEDACDERGIRMLGILEEGFADAWAVGVTGDTRFTWHSLSAMGDSRDPARFVRSRHCFSQAALEQEFTRTAKLEGPDREAFWNSRQYEVGTIVAAALYRAGEAEGTDYDRVLESLLASYRASGPGSLRELVATDPDGTTVATFAAIARSLIAAAVDEPTAEALCASLVDRLSLDKGELEGLCLGVPSNGQCR